MTELKQDFWLYRGDYREMTFTIRRQRVVNKVTLDLGPLDLTDFPIRWQAWKEIAGGEELAISKSVALGTVSVVNVDGSPVTILDAVRFDLLQADTAGLEPDRFYRHECETRDLLGKPSTLFEGSMHLLRDLVI